MERLLMLRGVLLALELPKTVAVKAKTRGETEIV
jgi:hypothetical protein